MRGTAFRDGAAVGVDEVARVVTAPLKPVALNGDSWLWYDQTALAGCGEIDLLVIDGPPCRCFTTAWPPTRS